MTSIVLDTDCHVAAMSASRAESDYGSDFGDDVDLELGDVLDDRYHRAPPSVGSRQQDGTATKISAAHAAMPTVLLDHDMDEYGWREGGIEVLEDDAGILLMPMEIDNSQGEVRRECLHDL